MRAICPCLSAIVLEWIDNSQKRFGIIFYTILKQLHLFKSVRPKDREADGSYLYYTRTVMIGCCSVILLELIVNNSTTSCCRYDAHSRFPYVRRLRC